MCRFKDIAEDDLDRVDGEVVIDLFVEVVAGLEKLHHFKVVLVRIDYLIVDHSCIVQ